jgi:short-subunit dehydrogenase
VLAVVTGASSGIGEATARRLVREPGARLILVARREERLDALAAELGGAAVVAADVTDDDAPARIAGAVEEHGGRLDLLVNNAGAAWPGSFREQGYAVVRRTMDLNFDAVVRLTEELLPALERAAPSAIVNVASVAGRVAGARSGAYVASKFALVGWSEALRAELEPTGVHVGLVLPGFIRTEGFRHEPLHRNRRTRWMVSRPEVVADAVADVGLGRRHERYVPRPYGIVPFVRHAVPPLWRRTGGRGWRR